MIAIALLPFQISGTWLRPEWVASGQHLSIPIGSLSPGARHCNSTRA